MNASNTMQGDMENDRPNLGYDSCSYLIALNSGGWTAKIFISLGWKSIRCEKTPNLSLKNKVWQG